MVHQPPRRGRAEVAHHAAAVRGGLVPPRLAEQARGDAGPQPVDDGPHLRGRVLRALADQQRDPLAGVEHLRGGGQVRLERQHPRHPPLRGRDHHPVGVRRLLGRRGDLHVVGQHDHARGAGGQRRAEGPVDHQGGLLGGQHHLQELRGDVLEQAGEVDLLLVLRTQGGRRLLADDRHDGLVVELGVVQAVEHVHGARALGGDDDPDAAGVLRVTDGHEGGVLLVARLHERRVAVGPAQRAHEAVDAVAGVAEDAGDAPGTQPLDDQVCDQSVRHGSSSGGMHAATGPGRDVRWLCDLCREPVAR